MAADLNFKHGKLLEADKPKTIAEGHRLLRPQHEAGGARVAALNGEQLATPVEFMGVFNLLAFAYLGFLSNHSIQHQIRAFAPRSSITSVISYAVLRQFMIGGLPECSLHEH